MQDLLNILQQIKDQAEPTLTQSIYERHPTMLMTDIIFGIIVVLYIIVALANIFGRSDEFPVWTVVLMTIAVAIQSVCAPHIPIRDDTRIGTTSERRTKGDASH